MAVNSATILNSSSAILRKFSIVVWNDKKEGKNKRFPFILANQFFTKNIQVDNYVFQPGKFPSILSNSFRNDLFKNTSKYILKFYSTTL